GEALAVLLVDRSALRRVPEDQIQDRVEVRLAPSQLDALARELDRRRQQLPPRLRAVGTVRLLETERRPGNGTGGGSDPEHLGRAAGEIDIHLLHLPEAGLVQAQSGHRDEEVEYPRGVVSRAVDEHEST